jgi:hypothetical protein
MTEHYLLSTRRMVRCSKDAWIARSRIGEPSGISVRPLAKVFARYGTGNPERRQPVHPFLCISLSSSREIPSEPFRKQSEMSSHIENCRLSTCREIPALHPPYDEWMTLGSIDDSSHGWMGTRLVWRAKSIRHPCWRVSTCQRGDRRTLT